MSTDASTLIDFPAFVQMMAGIFEAVGLDYAISGAVAVIPWGDARSTQDLDVAVYLPESSIQQLSEELLKHGIALPPDIISEVLLNSNLPIDAIHGYSGFKAEIFMLRQGDRFGAAALNRRKRVNLGAFGQLYVFSAEDLILYKLQYYALSRQTKHIRDVAGILSRSDVDMAYIEEWTMTLNLQAVWQEVQDAFKGKNPDI